MRVKIRNTILSIQFSLLYKVFKKATPSKFGRSAFPAEFFFVEIWFKSCEAGHLQSFAIFDDYGSFFVQEFFKVP